MRALHSWLVVAALVLLSSCAHDTGRAVVSIEPEGMTDTALDFGSIDTAELTAGECFKLGGGLVMDASCPRTSYGNWVGNDGKRYTVSGSFRCRGKGQAAHEGICVNESQ